MCEKESECELVCVFERERVCVCERERHRDMCKIYIPIVIIDMNVIEAK